VQQPGCDYKSGEQHAIPAEYFGVRESDQVLRNKKYQNAVEAMDYKICCFEGERIEAAEKII
jgi:hypothetical protein